MSNYIVAIDLGSANISGIVAQRNQDGLLNILAMETEPSMGVRRGLVINHSEAAGCVGRIIKKLQNRTKLEIGKVYIGRGGHTLKSIINKVPTVFDGEQELTSEIVEQLYKQNLDLAFPNATTYEIIDQDFVIDGEIEYNPVGCHCTQVEASYLLVLGKQNMDERICSCLERIPQKYAAIFTSPIAMSESLVASDEKELGCAVIDFGAETTSVVVYANHYIRHVAVIPLGGKVVTQDIRDLKVTALDAEKLKKNFGFAMLAQDVEPKAIKIKTTAGEHIVHTKEMNAIIEARMDEIMDLVCDEIYKSGYMSKLGAGLIITGGASQLKGLEDLIEIKTGMSVRKGDCSAILAEDTDPQYISPANTLIFGLANLGNENCIATAPEPDKTIAQVVPPTAENKAGKKNSLKNFGEKLSGLLFNDRDFEE